MFTLIICILLILYYVRHLIDINGFLTMLDEPRFPFMDAVFIVGSLLWMVLQLFLYSGPAVIIAIICLIYWDQRVDKPWKKRKISTKAILILLIILNIVIGVNHIHFQYSMWKGLFNIFF